MSNEPSVDKQSSAVLLSDDDRFLMALRTSFGKKSVAGLSIIETKVTFETLAKHCAGAATIIVDLDDTAQDDAALKALQRFMTLHDKVTAIAVVKEFGEATVRKLVQMRVSDILVKPVSPMEVLRVCAAPAGQNTPDAQIHTFLPVAGGVGATTLAIQAALALRSQKGTGSVCLVDLNFHNGTCASYLDLKPRLDLEEIELKPERLDRQLLEGMIARHSSGLPVIATGWAPTKIDPVPSHIVLGLLNVVCQGFENIVLDMPASWQSWTDNLALGSNQLFLVSDATVPCVSRTKSVADDLIKRLGVRVRPKVVVNKFDKRLFGSGLRETDLRRAIGDAFTGTVPLDRGLVVEAIDRGVPLAEVRKKSNVELAVRQIVLPQRPKRANPLGSIFSSRPANLAWRGAS